MGNPAGEFDFFGSKLFIQGQRIFKELQEIQFYADQVLTNYQNRSSAQIESVRVRKRKGNQEAHYEFESRTIAIPVDANWAMKELVVLHELAHHITWQKDPNVQAHGPEFLQLFLDIVMQEMGSEVALILRAALDAQGLRIEILK